MASDQTLFLREDGVERSWEIVAPVLDSHDSVHPYAAGTWGPSAADDLIAPRDLARELSLPASSAFSKTLKAISTPGGCGAAGRRQAS